LRLHNELEIGDLAISKPQVSKQAEKINNMNLLQQKDRRDSSRTLNVASERAPEQNIVGLKNDAMG
jgi:hypothetical protein